MKKFLIISIALFVAGNAFGVTFSDDITQDPDVLCSKNIKVGGKSGVFSKTVPVGERDSYISSGYKCTTNKYLCERKIRQGKHTKTEKLIIPHTKKGEKEFAGYLCTLYEPHKRS